jgi:hypothetical protein
VDGAKSKEKVLPFFHFFYSKYEVKVVESDINRAPILGAENFS